MSKGRTFLPQVIASAVLVAVLSARHHDYYIMIQWIRWLLCPMFIYIALSAKEKKRLWLVYGFGVLAAFYNPIFKVDFDDFKRDEMEAAFVATIIFCIISIPFLKSRHLHEGDHIKTFKVSSSQITDSASEDACSEISEANMTPVQSNVDQSKTFLGGSTHPWRRFFARTVDVFVIGLPLSFCVMFCVMFCLGLAFPQNDTTIMAKHTTIMANKNTTDSLKKFFVADRSKRDIGAYATERIKYYADEAGADLNETIDCALMVQWMAARTGKPVQDVSDDLDSYITSYFGKPMTPSAAYDTITANYDALSRKTEPPTPEPTPNQNSIASFVKALENPIIAAVVFYLLWFPCEAIFLALTGTTPAKWLFGIRVLDSSGAFLSFGSALNRSFSVFFYGQGMGIPFVAIFTQPFAYRRLTKTGTTLWDTRVNSIVTHRRWGFFRALFCVIAVIAAFLFLGILITIGNKY